jgi:hypothetical protein
VSRRNDRQRRRNDLAESVLAFMRRDPAAARAVGGPTCHLADVSAQSFDLVLHYMAEHSLDVDSLHLLRVAAVEQARWS